MRTNWRGERRQIKKYTRDAALSEEYCNRLVDQVMITINTRGLQFLPIRVRSVKIGHKLAMSLASDIMQKERWYILPGKSTTIQFLIYNTA